MKKLAEYDQSAVKLAQSASQTILRFNLHRELTQRPPNELLFHYTNADGLKGIIENNELWASSAYFLNDPNEITYGYDLLREALEKSLRDAEKLGEKNSLKITLVTELCRFFGDDLLKKKIITPIYLVCFCEEDNLLSQWRAYGQAGGYSIGLRVPTVETASEGQGFRAEPVTYTSVWAKVEYDKTEQTKQCSALLNSMLGTLNLETCEAIRRLSDHPFLGYNSFARVIREILLEEVLRFKNEAFKVEKEWRIIIRQRELKKQSMDDGGKSPLSIYFRSLRGMLVPYVKLIPANPALNTLPIKRIRTGPTLDKETAKMAISLMLEKKGYPGVKVEGSDIAVRF